MKVLLIANIVGLAIAAIICTVCFIGWLKAEKKLAKHGESTLYTKKTK